MTKIILSTGNIVSGGPSIIRKPGAYRSNLELTNSLRSAFLAAREDHPPPSPSSDSNATNGAVVDPQRPPSRSLPPWTELDSAADTLYIPRLSPPPAPALQEPSSHYDITAKLFFLPSADASRRGAHARDALALVFEELGVSAVDLLIASFPGMSFDGDCEWEADKLNAAQGDSAEEAATWRELEGVLDDGLVRRLGIAEFGSEKLARFLDGVRVRPAVDQINIRNCCNVPPPLVQLAKSAGIELLVHSDCTDILPTGTLRELLGHGFQGAGVLADGDGEGEGLAGDIVPLWVVKYTAFVRDRGVIENKGYFAVAELQGSR